MSRIHIAVATAALFFASLAVGRAGPCGDPPMLPPLEFDDPVIVDEMRAGGEPSIQPLPDGTLIYVSHAGTTQIRHRNAADPAFVLPYTNSDYLWRSTDGGETWTYVGLAGTEVGPHAVTGFSDPTTAVDAAGNVYVAGITLANVYVAKSADAGRTWRSQPLAAVASDREWLAADREDEVYLNANQEGLGRRLWKSTDGGLTWSVGVDLPGGGAPSPIAVDPSDGRLYFPASDQGQSAGIPAQVAIFPNARASLDQMQTRTIAGGLPHAHGFVNAIAIDAGGNVYIVSNTSSRVRLAMSTDRGMTWTTRTIATSTQTVLWPWVAAGADGHVGVSWLQGNAGTAGWKVMAAQTATAHGWTDACGVSHDPTWETAVATEDPIHFGDICENGLGCQAQVGSDRRLGDYHTNAITPDGRLVIAYGTTTPAPNSAVSRPGFVRQLSWAGE